jgi:reductive dehalogenase
MMNLQVLKKTCSPNQCELECVDICPQNKKGKITIKIEKDLAIIYHNNCISCLQCVYVCPFEAIEIEIEGKKRLTPKILKTTSKKSDTREQIFEINEEVYQQFNEKYTIFNRRMWDEDFEGFKRPIYEKAHERSLLGIDGYSDLEQAAADGAWAIENLVSMREFMMERIKTLKEEDARALREQQQKRDMRQVNYDIHKPPKFEVKDPQEMTTYLKKIATLYGSDLIGIAPFDTKWIYSQDRMDKDYVIPESIKFAVVIAVEMDYNAINTSPKMPGGIATGLGYSKQAFVRTLLANFIRNLGYEAIPAGNSLGLSVPLAIEAGLGGFGRHGILITKKFGPRVRIAKILTDLPLVAEKLDYKFAKSVEKFCETCKTCAEKCPSASIPFDDKISFKSYSVSNNPGIKKWYIDVESCFMFWIENGGDCSNCISDCEYNHIYTWPHKVANWIVMNLPFLNPIWPQIGKLLSYGGNKSAKKMWKKIKPSP